VVKIPRGVDFRPLDVEAKVQVFAALTFEHFDIAQDRFSGVGGLDPLIP
jgi:hypothetical protein